MAITASSDAIDLSPSSTSLSGLDGVNFFLAGMQSGFGPFVAVLLADEKWTQQNIGLVLSASGLAGLLSQLPGGELLDASRSKRFLVALGGSSSRSARSPSHFGQAFRWSLLPWCCKGSPAGSWAGNRCDQPRLGRSLSSCRTTWTQSTLRRDRSRDGRRTHGRYRLFSVVSSDIPRLCRTRASVACSLARIRSTDIHFGRACGQPDHDASTPPPRARRLSLWKNHSLLTFAGCLFLFQFGNASMLPLAGEELAYRSGTNSSLIISALIIVPQIIVALAAPWAGRQAQSWGRRPLLLIGFSALTVRALLFAVTTNPLLLIGIQLLDGISGSVLGVLTALIVADLTKGTGRFNLAQGFVGTLAGIGASLSTTLFSLVVGNFGDAVGFVGIAG